MLGALRAAHVLGVAAWGAALLLLIGGLWRHARTLRSPEASAPSARRWRRVYRGVAAPAFFVAAFTGVALLHQEPRLALGLDVQLEVGAFVLLMGVDHLAMRGADGMAEGSTGDQGRRYAALLAVTSLLLGVAWLA